jgi:hypothetical protein
MRRLLGILALCGFATALAEVLAQWTGRVRDLPSQMPLIFLELALFGAMVVRGALAGRGVPFVVPREVLAGALAVAVFAGVSFAWPDVPAGGRAAARDGGFAVVLKGKVVRTIPESVYVAATRADRRCTAAMAMFFFYGPMVVFLAPAGFFSPQRRPRRFGDLRAVSTLRVRPL